MIEITRKTCAAFEALRWVSGAVREGDSRGDPLSNLRTELKRKKLHVVGCDARRLHSYELPADKVPESLRKTALWKVRKRTKTVLWLEKNTEGTLKYPDWRTVIPPESMGIEVARCHLPEALAAALTLRYSKRINMDREKFPIFDHSYLSAALEIFEGLGFRACQECDTRPLLIKGESGATAVVMTAMVNREDFGLEFMQGEDGK